MTWHRIRYPKSPLDLCSTGSQTTPTPRPTRKGRVPSGARQPTLAAWGAGLLATPQPRRGSNVSGNSCFREKYMTIAKLGKTLVVLAVLAAAFLVVSASAESKARIVRLSEVEGTVQIDRSTGDGFDKAFVNLPVIEGCKLKTGKDGRAEVEFEDARALRLAPDSEVDFTRLALGDNGQKLNTAQLVSGTVYANLHPKNAGNKAGDQFQLNFVRESVSVAEAAHFRVALAGTSKARLAGFKG